MWGLDNGAHGCHAQVDVDIGAAGLGPIGLSDKSFKVWRYRVSAPDGRRLGEYSSRT